MSKPVVFVPEAEADFLQAFQWYERRSFGLGQSFVLCVDAVLSAMREFPEAFPIVLGTVRRALTRKFPFGIFYLNEPGRILVLSIFHLHQAPDVWKARVE